MQGCTTLGAGAGGWASIAPGAVLRIEGRAQVQARWGAQR